MSNQIFLAAVRINSIIDSCCASTAQIPQTHPNLHIYILSLRVELRNSSERTDYDALISMQRMAGPYQTSNGQMPTSLFHLTYVGRTVELYKNHPRAYLICT